MKPNSMKSKRKKKVKTIKVLKGRQDHYFSEETEIVILGMLAKYLKP